VICPNKACARVVSVYDEKCSYCGTSLGSHPVKDYVAIANEIVLKSRQKLELILKSSPDTSWIKEFDKKAGTDRPFQSTTEHHLTVDSTVENIAGPPVKNVRLEEAIAMVFHNPHVTDNPAFSAKAQLTRTFYDNENMGLNAFADLGPNEEGYVIVLFDGYMNFMIAVDAIFAVKAYDRFGDLGLKIKENGYQFSLANLASFFHTLPRGPAGFEKSFLSCFETIAHELGHICYDHVFGPGYDNMSLDEARNMERDADSFAASVINRSLFSKEFFISHLKTCVAWSVVEKVGGYVEPGTHPLATERLTNAIRSNSEMARELGVDESFVRNIFG